MDFSRASTRELLEGDDALELSFVELILVAADCSEDESEISDLVDGLLGSGRVQLSPTPAGQQSLGHPEACPAPL